MFLPRQKTMKRFIIRNSVHGTSSEVHVRRWSLIDGEWVVEISDSQTHRVRRELCPHVDDGCPCSTDPARLVGPQFGPDGVNLRVMHIIPRDRHNIANLRGSDQLPQVYCPHCGATHPHSCPSPDEIKEICADIREGWTDTDYARASHYPNPEASIHWWER